MNNYTKKIFYNFIFEFEGCSPVELQKNNLFMYCNILNWITTPTSLKELNKELEYIIKDLYLIEIKDPIKVLEALK